MARGAVCRDDQAVPEAVPDASAVLAEMSFAHVGLFLECSLSGVLRPVETVFARRKPRYANRIGITARSRFSGRKHTAIVPQFFGFFKLTTVRLPFVDSVR